MKRSLIPFSLFLVLSGGNNAVFGYAVIGAGSSTCGQILEEEKNRKNTEGGYWLYVSWIQWFISWKNSMNGSDKGKNTSYESLYYSVIKYCRENPIKRLSDAVEEIYQYQIY